MQIMDDEDIGTVRRKPRGSGGARRGEILAAAKQLFLTDGYQQTTIRRIAAAVGVSSGALYLYFPDKDAILQGIAEDTFATLLSVLEAAGRDVTDPLTRLRGGMRAYIAFGRAHPDEYRLTFLSKMMTEATPGRSCHGPSAIEAADRSFNMLLEDTTRLIAAGVFRQMAPCEAAEALWACLHGITAVLLDHGMRIETAHDRLADSVVDIAIAGMMEKKSPV